MKPGGSRDASSASTARAAALTSLEAATARLQHRRLLDIRYADINSLGHVRRWDYDSWHHAVMGVEFITDQGSVSLAWTSTFDHWGIGVFATPIDEHLNIGGDGCEVWSASTNPRWAPNLGKSINRASLHWRCFPYAVQPDDGDKPVDPMHDLAVPVSLQLDLDAGPVWFIVAEPHLPAADSLEIAADEIMVVFTANRMTNFGLADAVRSADSQH